MGVRSCIAAGCSLVQAISCEPFRASRLHASGVVHGASVHDPIIVHGGLRRDNEKLYMYEYPDSLPLGTTLVE
jgi:hypothetical protein